MFVFYADWVGAFLYCCLGGLGAGFAVGGGWGGVRVFFFGLFGQGTGVHLLAGLRVCFWPSCRKDQTAKTTQWISYICILSLKASCRAWIQS